MPDKREPAGATLGLLTFIGGLILIGFAFQQAFALFNTPPRQALGIESEAVIDLGQTVDNLQVVVVRVLLVLVMCIIGSVISNRGIRLYQAALQDSGPVTSSQGEPIAVRARPDDGEPI